MSKKSYEVTARCRIDNKVCVPGDRLDLDEATASSIPGCVREVDLEADAKAKAAAEQQASEDAEAEAALKAAADEEAKAEAKAKAAANKKASASK